MCEGNPYNEWHVFFDCIHAENVWRNCGLLHDVKNAMEVAESFKECFFHLPHSLDDTKKKVLAMMCWALWKRMNELYGKG